LPGILERFIYVVIQSVVRKGGHPAKMGQQEVYDFLKSHKGRRFTGKDISEKLSVSIGSVTNSLKRLRESGQVTFGTLTKNKGVRATYWYKYKR